MMLNLIMGGIVAVIIIGMLVFIAHESFSVSDDPAKRQAAQNLDDAIERVKQAWDDLIH